MAARAGPRPGSMRIRFEVAVRRSTRDTRRRAHPRPTGDGRVARERAGALRERVAANGSCTAPELPTARAGGRAGTVARPRSPPTFPRPAEVLPMRLSRLARAFALSLPVAASFTGCVQTYLHASRRPPAGDGGRSPPRSEPRCGSAPYGPPSGTSVGDAFMAPASPDNWSSSSKGCCSANVESCFNPTWERPGWSRYRVSLPQNRTSLRASGQVLDPVVASSILSGVPVPRVHLATKPPRSASRTLRSGFWRMSVTSHLANGMPRSAPSRLRLGRQTSRSSDRANDRVEYTANVAGSSGLSWPSAREA